MTTTPNPNASAATTAQSTIIDDAQFRFPVSTDALAKWEAANGRLTAGNYGQFCDEVKCSLPDVQVGTAEMIDVCAALIESGASVRSVK